MVNNSAVQMGSVGIKDWANLDAFSRLRTSTTHSQFDSQFTYDLQPLLFEQKTNWSWAAIAHDATNRMALLTFASTPTGGFSYMQSYEHFRYTSGNSQLIFATFNFIAQVANTLKFCGYSDWTEGIEFQNNGTANQFVLYSTTTNGNQTVLQTAWNIDKLDWTWPSGLTLDITKTQILVIDLQALYVGRVRIGFDINWIIVYCHQFTHANKIANPYIKTANLPLRCGMSCTGTVSTTMNFVCSTVKQENWTNTNEWFHFWVEGTVTAGNGAKTHILSLQPKTTFNSIDRKSVV